MRYGTDFGRGFGFRGYSPAWTDVGRGRGGLPRSMAFSHTNNPQAAEGQSTVSETGMSFLGTQARKKVEEYLFGVDRTTCSL